MIDKILIAIILLDIGLYGGDFINTRDCDTNGKFRTALHGDYECKKIEVKND